MIEVLVKCPVTGNGIDAGVTTDELISEISWLATHTTDCPHCNTTHPWRRSDAYINQDDDKALIDPPPSS